MASLRRFLAACGGVKICAVDWRPGSIGGGDWSRVSIHIAGRGGVGGGGYDLGMFEISGVASGEKRR